ncbi:MAG: hypothetical protein HRJ53_24315 [Acidobacteria bacterium Pan2503]|uniref:Uncharacterized protein n=1 Tax=Candidatus Acidiferrum panamense TaxID=2741543 RepID=A0A7V8NVB8_9BACT|nr:hypothetical protein [Candidatus Acidoferrum panamensis]
MAHFHPDWSAKNVAGAVSGALGEDVAKEAAERLRKGEKKPATTLADVEALPGKIWSGLKEAGTAFKEDPGGFTGEMLTGLLTPQKGGAFAPVAAAPLRAAEAVEHGVAATRAARTAQAAAEAERLTAQTAARTEPVTSKVAEEAPKLTRKEAALQAARQEGMPVPPSMRGDRPIAGAVESLAGKVKTAQAFSQKSQPIAQNLVRRDMGMAAETELTPEAYEASRRDAYRQGYEPIKRLGTPFKTDNEYEQAIENLQGTWSKTAKKYPALLEDPDIAKFQQALPKGTKFLEPGKGISTLPKEIDPEDAINLIQGWREKARPVLRNPNASSAEKELARAKLRAADATEKMVERNLVRDKQGQLIDNFRNARKRIAKSFDYEKATNEAGEIDMRKLAAINRLKRGVMEDEQKTLADYGAHFPKAAQLPSKIGGEHTFGPMDLLAAAKEPALLFARPAARAALLSDWGQRGLDIGAGGVARAAGRTLSEGFVDPYRGEFPFYLESIPKQLATGAAHRAREALSGKRDDTPQ